MYANVSIKVTPGSVTLWSVHSGHRAITSRLASSTSSWNPLSSRFGAGSAISAHPPHEVPPRPLSQLLLVSGDGIEREYEVARIVRAFDRVRNVDSQHARLSRLRGHRHVGDGGPGLTQQQRRADLCGDGGRVLPRRASKMK